MQIVARYTPQSIQEATALNRRLWQRAIRLATSARALVYLVAGLWLGFALITRGLRATPIRPRDIATGAVVLLVMATIAVAASWHQSHQIQKALRSQPDQEITFESKGVTVGGTFEPWSSYTHFHEGRTIVALTRANKSSTQAIPTDTLTPTQTGELRSILLTHLPEKL